MTGASKMLLAKAKVGEKLMHTQPLPRKKKMRRRRSMFIPVKNRYARRAKRNSTGFMGVPSPDSTPSRICASDSTPFATRNRKKIRAKKMPAVIPCVLNSKAKEDLNISSTASDIPEKDGWVTYIVGGQPFEVARTTVLKYPDTILAKMITSEFDKSDLRIDRDPTRFRYILNWFRDGRVILPINIAKEEIITEVRYYNLPLLESDIQYASFPHISALADFQRHVQEVVSTSCDKFESMIDGLICSLLNRDRRINQLRHANEVALRVARELKRQLNDCMSLCSRGFNTSCLLPEVTASSFRTRGDVEIALEIFTNTKKYIVDAELFCSEKFLTMVNRSMKKYDVEVEGISKDGVVNYRIMKPS